jgi:hypothetical protein
MAINRPVLIIYVPVVYKARDIMILMRANPLHGPLEGVGPENRDFFGPPPPPLMGGKSITRAIGRDGL